MAVITIYHGARAPHPVDARDLTWGEIATEIEAMANEPTAAPLDADVEEQKKRMLSWAPHALREGATRNATGVAHVSMLVVDVDHGATPEEIVAYLHEEGIPSIVYESAKSTPEAPRFRVVVPITDPIPPEACRETRTRFAEFLGLPPDCGVLTAIEASKLFFSGRAHGTPPRRVWRTEGVPVDAATLPPNSAVWAEQARAAPAAASPHLAELPPADAGIVAALGDWRAHAGRKWSLCGAIGGMMRKAAYTSHQAEAVIRAWLPADDPSVDVDAGVSWALGAWQHAPEDVSGYQELAALLGEPHARVIVGATHSGSWAGVAVPHAPLARSPAWLKPAAAPAPAPDGSALGPRLTFADADVPIDYLCHGLRLAPSQGKISLLAGLPGAAKGPILDHLAICFAFGLPAFGRLPCVRSSVLLLDCEGWRLSMRRMARLARAVGLTAGALEQEIDVRNVGSSSLLSDATFYAIQASGAKVVLLDSYTTAMMVTGIDMNKIEFAQLAQMLAALDVLVLVNAHANKAPLAGEKPTLQQVAGSFALAAMAQTGLVSWHPDKDADPNRVSLACMRTPETPFASFDVAFTDTASGDLAVSMISGAEIAQVTAAERNVDITRAVNSVLSYMVTHAVPWQRKALREAVLVGGLNPTETVITRAVALLVNAGLVTMHAGVGAKPPTYEIRSVQATPRSVVVGPDGEITVYAPGLP